MFERFTDGARRVVVYAQEECRELRHQHIGTEHLLLALLHEDNPTGSALREAGVTHDAVREQLEQTSGRGKREASGHLPFTPRAKRVLEGSVRHAERLGQASISRAHLLNAMLDARDCGGVQLLVAVGADLNALAARADELGSVEEPSGPRPVADTGGSSPGPGLRPRRRRPFGRFIRRGDGSDEPQTPS